MNFKFSLSSLCFLLLLLSYDSHSQTSNDLKDQNLKGRVKLVKEKEYQGKYDKGIIVTDKLHFVNTYEFDLNGNLTVDSVYGGTEPLYRDTFYYKNGNLFAKKQNLLGHSSNEFDWNYRRDNVGHIVEEQFEDFSNPKLNWKIVSRYDSSGNQAENYRYTNDGKLSTRSKYQYDRKGNLVDLKMYDAKDSLLVSAVTKYDTNSNKIEEVGYLNGEVKKYTYKYDVQNNKVEECYYEGDSLIDKTNFVYSDFDNKGNWRKKVAFYFEKLNEIYLREIIYY